MGVLITYKRDSCLVGSYLGMNMIQMLSSGLDEFCVHWVAIVKIAKMKHLIAEVNNARSVLFIYTCLL